MVTFEVDAGAVFLVDFLGHFIAHGGLAVRIGADVVGGKPEVIFWRFLGFFLEHLVIGGASQGLLVAFERDDAFAEGGAFQFLGVFAYLVEHL